MTSKKNDTRCKALAKNGKPCRAAPTKGGLCYLHANPNKAAELGRIGGRKNRHVPAEHVNPLPCLENALAVQETVARLINEIYSGKLDPRMGSGLAPLLRVHLRAIETLDLAHERYRELDWGDLPQFVTVSSTESPETSGPDGKAQSGRTRKSGQGV